MTADPDPVGFLPPEQSPAALPPDAVQPDPGQPGAGDPPQESLPPCRRWPS